MRFLCMCLSPAIDATVRLNAWPSDGCIIKDAVDTFAPGGKGLNVARWLAVRSLAEASGKALVEGVKAHPDVIKPNAEECEALIGFVPKAPEEFQTATVALKAFCDYPIISDGGAGCWFDGTFVPAPKVEVLDTTAAGDPLLAEWGFQFFTSGRESASPLALRYSVAAGSAACTMPGGESPDVALVEKLAQEIAG